MKLFIYFLLFFPCLAVAQVQESNSAEGVLVGNEIYLRDLYRAYGTAPTHVSGVLLNHLSAQSQLLERIKNLDVDERLLLQKLSDAELLSRNLGTYILIAIAAQNWFFVTDLSLGPDTAPIDTQMVRFPLVRRELGLVKIHEKNFRALRSDHKVALIIREAIYMLLKTQGSNCQVLPCQQSGYEAGVITSAIFEKNNCPAAILGSCFNLTVSAMLNVDRSIETGWSDYRITALYTDLKTGKSASLQKIVPIGSSSLQTVEIVMQTCEALFLGASQSSVVNAVLWISRAGYYFEPYYYRTFDGTKINIQLGGIVKLRENATVVALHYRKIESCQLHLVQLAGKWFIPPHKL